MAHLVSTYWSCAQKKGRETEASGIGWELFKNYLIAKEKFKPDYFLYENNKSAAQPIKDQIARELEVPEHIDLLSYDNGHRLTYINSALVSAQNRQRFYVTNFGDIAQPKDRGILLRDILDSGVNLTSEDKAYCLTSSYQGATPFNTIERNQRTMVAEPVCLNSQSGRNGIEGLQPSLQDRIYSIDGKATAVTTAFNPQYAKPYRVGALPKPNGELSTSQAFRIYSIDGKSVTQSAGGGGAGGKTGLYAVPTDKPIYEVKDGQITIKGKRYPIKLADGYYIIRKLTVNECKKLQTVPDWYVFPVSSTRVYKMLGNAWTVEVIKHILSHIPNIRNEEIEVLSMYDGMSCGYIALKEMGCNVKKYYATEIDKYAIQTSQFNFPDILHLGDAFQVRNENWKI